MTDAKTKHKKSRKHKSKDSSHSTTVNGIEASSKRKRESEPGNKNKKKKLHAGDDHVNGTSPDAAEEADRNPPITNGLHNADSSDIAKAPVTPAPAEKTPDSEPNGTPTSKGKKIRGARMGGQNGKKIGFFEEHETRKVENHKVEFCNLHNLDATAFDAMVQHSEREGSDFPCPADICSKSEFWTSIYELLPDRDRRSIYRFMRRHFQDSGQKPHEWTPAQDEELVKLRAEHGPKYAFIARIIGRSDDDVTQRWKNRLEHRSTMKRGAWSEQELRDLMQYVLQVGESHQQLGLSSDVYEMDEKLVPWGKISDQMNNTRSRQQCADKWRKIRRAVLQVRATSDPSAVFDVVDAARRSSRGSEKFSGAKSKEYVEEDDSDDETNEQITAAPPQPMLANQSPAANIEAPLTGLDAVAAPESESESDDDREDATGSQKTGKPQKRKPVEEEPSSEVEQPSSPVIEKSHPTDKKEKKRRKKETRERKAQEHAEATGLTAAQAKEELKKAKKERKEEKKRRKSLKAAAAIVDDDASTTTSPEKKKHRKSGFEPNDSAVGGQVRGELSKKEKRKEKKKYGARRASTADDSQVEHKHVSPVQSRAGSDNFSGISDPSDPHLVKMEG